jgi:Protein of unknown function (DUF1634)
VRDPADREAGREVSAVQTLLRTGLLVSVATMATGLAWALFIGHRFAAPIRLGSLLSDGTGPDRVTAVGVLVLALTPAARVVTLLVLWARERDWRYVGVGVTVVAVLGLAMLVGRA